MGAESTHFIPVYAVSQKEGKLEKIHRQISDVKIKLIHISSIQFSCSVMSDSLQPGTIACQAPLSMEF